MTMHLLGLTSTPEAAFDFADHHGGRAWAAHPTQKPSGPYAGMFEVSTDDLAGATEAADRGLHVSFRRVIKPAASNPDQRCIASFGMIHHGDHTWASADAHWRDVHGPLALRCHLAMCDYEQLSVLHTVHGPALHGMAMCAFPDRDTLSERFFNDDAARAEVIADVSSFADTRASLPRVVLVQTR